MFYQRILVLCLSFLLFLSGCHSPVYNQAEANVADVKERQLAAYEHMRQETRPPSSLVVNKGAYIDRTPISIYRQPGWLSNQIVLRGDQLPFSYFSRTIGGQYILTHYQTGLDEKLMLSMNYSGTVKGALDLLAAKTGYIYTVSRNNIYWQAFVTKTFDIAFMPGASDYMMGKQGGGTSASQTGPGGAGGTGQTTTISGTLDDSANTQYSNLKGTLSVWRDLRDSITQLLSPGGRVFVSEATTSVTVRDRPYNVNLISRFISNLNNKLSKQVLIKINVLQVNLENDFNYGINWNVVQHAFGNSNYQLVSNNGSPLSLVSALGLATAGTSAGLNNPSMLTNPDASGVIALVQALQTQGKVSVVTQPQVIAQNNQVSEIRIVDQKGYLASVQTTSLSGSSTGGASITSQITPGAVVTGLTLYVLPKILGNKVYLQVNADLSSNLGIETITSNGANLQAGAPPAGTSIIQVPHVQQKQFNQRAVIRSGDTLILAGFKQVQNLVGASQLFNSQTLGGKTAQETNTETIVLITPLILHGFA